MILAMILIPAVAGVAVFFTKRPFVSRTVLVAAAAFHLALVAASFLSLPPPALNAWLSLDSVGLIFLGITSILFLLASIYRIGINVQNVAKENRDFVDGFLFKSAPEATFCGSMLIFLSSMTLVCVSNQFGILWVAIEATTLASAPLIYFHRHKRSLEAAWKYLLICSVGIAFALLGNFFLAVSLKGNAVYSSLIIDDLVKFARMGGMDSSWLKGAFLLLLVGYGTKMGLAPMHTWLPDAHSEAPSVVSALLSGALLNCSFLGILRTHAVCSAAGLGNFDGGLLVFFGLLSMAFAAVFVLGQKDFKRMLAYSSVEHVGILAFGVGLGKLAVFGALFHAINHSLTKAMLFLVAGNILSSYRTKYSGEVTGLLKSSPYSGAMWLAGFLAITGFPPFGTFLSEFTILTSAILGRQFFLAAVYVVLLTVVFIGMAGPFINMSMGESSVCRVDRAGVERIFAILPPAIMGIIVLAFGFYLPPGLRAVLADAARVIGGG